MAWKIEYTDTAKNQLHRLDKSVARRLVDYMDQVAVLDKPHLRGKVLTGNLGNLWRYRIGDYRAICDLQRSTLKILVIEVGHRKNIY